MHSHRKILIRIIAVLAITLIGCEKNPPMNEYQIASFIPMYDAIDAHFIVDGEELYCLFKVVSAAATCDSLYVFDITDPGQPALTRSESLPVAMNLWAMDHCASNAYTYNDYTGKLQALNMVSLDYTEAFIGEGLDDVAFKKGLLFAVGDSGLMVWDISNIKMPVRIFSEAESAAHSYKWIKVYDTIGFEAISTTALHYKLWNIANPRAPSVISEGDFKFHCSPEHAVVADYSIFLQRGDERHIMRYEFSGSDSLRLVDSTFYTHVFLVHDRQIIYLLQDIMRVGDAFDFSSGTIDVPLHDHAWIVEAVDDVIYVFAINKGIFVYRRKGD